MTPAQPTKQQQWQKLFDYIAGYQALWTVDVGLKSGLLQAVASHGPLSEQELARHLGFDPRYTAVWCRAAYAFELVEWDEQAGYRLAPHMAELLLDPADPQFLGGRMQFYAAINEDFRAFPAYLKSGGVWPRSEHDPFILQALESMTKPDAVMVTDIALPQSPGAVERLEAGGTILDIGAGAGFAVLHYARRFPKARVIGIEYDAAQVDLARRELAQAGVDTVEIRHADANQLEDEDAYDLVTLNVALHETGGPPEYQNVLHRVHRALKPGGTVVVSELPYPDSVQAYRGQPAYQALTGVQFHEALVGCGAITQNQLRDLLLAAGFSNARVVQGTVATRFVMVAEK
jgi:ubiquinone/menaquinone biosynthesis C-methylase UbiE